MGGRRRYLELDSRNELERHSAEREILSTFIQGTAADITKEAMVYLADQLPQVAKDANAKLVLQVHDELVIEVPRFNPTWMEIPQSSSCTVG